MYSYLFFGFSIAISSSVFLGILVNTSSQEASLADLEVSENENQTSEILLEKISENDKLFLSLIPEVAEGKTQFDLKEFDLGQESDLITSTSKVEIKNETLNYTSVPFYSQFADISSPNRKKVGCGVASLAMLIELYNPDQKVSVDQLFEDGLRAGAYLDNAGWIHSGLINLSKGYGLDGQSYGLADLSGNSAFERLKTVLKAGPVIASVHYTFDPMNPIPHLVVVNGIEGDRVYYNDPAETSGGNFISKDKFVKAWKKRYIEIRPIS